MPLRYRPRRRWRHSPRTRSRPRASTPQPIRREPAHRERQLAAGDDVLQPGRADHAAAARSGPGRRRSNVMKSGGEATASGSGSRKPLEAGPELLVVHRDLAVEHQRAGGELRHRRRDVAEPASVVAALAADEADPVAVRIGVVEHIGGHSVLESGAARAQDRHVALSLSRAGGPFAIAPARPTPPAAPPARASPS
jgi:hypothetical protein